MLIVVDSLGVDTRFVGPDELKEIEPLLETGGLAGGAYEPNGGYIDVTRMVLSWLAAAQCRGLDVLSGVRINGITTSGGKVSGVETAEGRIEAPIVINATGAWATDLLAPIGVDLPIERRRLDMAYLIQQPGKPNIGCCITDGNSNVVLGVLGCPNLPNADGSTGAIFAAVAGGGAQAWYGVAASAQPVRVAAPASLAEARFCESVESGHSNQDHSAEIAACLGIAAEPYRIDSQCKYAAVARGDASIYLRLPTRADYREKIWDHAAGKFVVERAGGVVTDVTGTPLDFSHGAKLETNSGVVATDGRFHDEVIGAVQAVLT